MEQKLVRLESIVCDLGRKKSRFGNGFELVLGVLVVVLVIIAIGVAARMFYTCKNKQDGDCHVYKWWDVAATEEIKAIGAQVTLLTDKVDSLSFVGYEETELRELKVVQFDMEQKLVRLESIVCDLGRKKSRFGNGFELVLGVLVVVLVIIAIGVAARM
ncbi:hypothetical protein DY000_02056241 [Brassica cretica]|uniref:DUF1664 domain-containing protein n=1 Tax=Brassica cretica TaxID=69181 RepID=A0ABQ7ALF9_BRACR|nr:hypothetical protein DY000_02056241 [Brassica cretica]